MKTTVVRKRVLAYRAFGQGLHRDTDVVEDLAVAFCSQTGKPNLASPMTERRFRITSSHP